MPATTGNSTIRTRELEFIMYLFLLHYARRFFCRGCTFACFTLLSRQMWVISNVCWKSVEFNVAGSWSICVCPTQKTFSTDKNQKCLTVLDRLIVLICLNDQANIAWFTSTRGVYQSRPRILSLQFIRDQWRSTQLWECKLQKCRSLLLHVEREENNSWPCKWDFRTWTFQSR